MEWVSYLPLTTTSALPNGFGLDRIDHVDEIVDNSPLGHLTSIFQSSSFMVLNDIELQTMESEWRHELDVLGYLDT